MIVPCFPTTGTDRPAIAPKMTMREGESGVPDRSSKGVRLDKCQYIAVNHELDHGSYSRVRWNMLRTFRSRTFVTAQSGVGSKAPPHVAAAFATRISTRFSAFKRSTSLSISESFERSAAYPVARPEQPGKALSLSTACLNPSGPSSFRAIITTFSAPASRSAVAVCSPRPRDPVHFVSVLQLCPGNWTTHHQ